MARREVPLTVSVESRRAEAYGEVYVIDSEIHVLSPELGLSVELPHSSVRIPAQSFSP
jgi:hypothetical protein